MDTQIPDATPAVLADLIAAGLVSHEMIGDPARLAGEAAALRALCALVGGTVYRLGAFHYAFRAGPGDLDGRLAGLAPGDWTAALETALQAVLGADAAWLNPAGLLGGEDPALDQPLLLLRARETAVAEGLAAAPAGVRAIVDAAYAAETARLIAGAAPGSESRRPAGGDRGAAGGARGPAHRPRGGGGGGDRPAERGARRACGTDRGPGGARAADGGAAGGNRHRRERLRGAAGADPGRVPCPAGTGGQPAGHGQGAGVRRSGGLSDARAQRRPARRRP